MRSNGPFAGAWAATVALAAVLSFLPALSSSWVYDDAFLVAHPAVQRRSFVSALLTPYWPPGTSADRLYRPSTIGSLVAEARVGGGLRSDLVRADNLVLHAATSIGVLRLASAAGLPPLAAALAALLFAAHPVHTEAVATGYGRSELLVALAGVILLRRAVARDPQSRTPADIALQTLAFAFAIGAKENGLLLWPAVLLIDLHHRRRQAAPPEPAAWSTRVLPRAHLGFAVTALLFLVVRDTVLAGSARLPDAQVSPWDDPLAGASLTARALSAFQLCAVTLRVLVDPSALSPVWSPPALGAARALTPTVAFGALAAAAFGALAWRGWRSTAPGGALAAATVPLLWVVLHLPPTVPHWIFAERWLYLPTVPLAVVAAAAAARLGRGPLLALTTALALAGILLSRSYTRAFASDVAMAQATVDRQPDSFHGWRNLALARLNSGDAPAALLAADEAERRYGKQPALEWVQVQAAVQVGDRARAAAALAALERRFPDGGPPVLRDYARRIEALPPR